MRILLVNWLDRMNPTSGGAEIHLHEIFGRLARGGHEITLLTSGWKGAPKRDTVDGIDVHRVGRRNTFPLRAKGYFRRWLSDEPWDVLVEDINKVPLRTPYWGVPRTMALVPHLFGSTVYQEASLPMASLVWLLERPLASVYGTRPFEAISDSTADDLVDRGIPRQLIRVIYPGIDSTFFTPNPASRSATPMFAYLGRLRRYKGIDIIIRAFARLKIPDARLYIAGSGNYRGELQKLVRSLDLTDRVRFLGFITETQKLALLRTAWALAFTSPKEGWGITNGEAAACGTPVVASDSPGLRESVRHGETGFLVPHGDVAALAIALSRLAGDRALVERLGENGRRFALRFTWERAAAETERHLRDIVG